MSIWPYSTARWKRLRELRLNLNPMCEGCLQAGFVRKANHVDHRKAISDGGDAFPEIAGLASLCASCHSAKTARGPEAGAIKTNRPRKGCDINGMPLDPDHPWNRDK